MQYDIHINTDKAHQTRVTCGQHHKCLEHELTTGNPGGLVVDACLVAYTGMQGNPLGTWYRQHFLVPVGCSLGTNSLQLSGTASASSQVLPLMNLNLGTTRRRHSCHVITSADSTRNVSREQLQLVYASEA